ncbi:MAG: glycosyltransferase family 39 protein [Armatimonadetes bacterium]|nr:glycosyltransferase family 39 protein [Armatimonadota bacterium]
MKTGQASRQEVFLLGVLIAFALALRIVGAWTDYPWCWYPDKDIVIHARNCINVRSPKLCPGEYIYPTGYVYLNAAVYALVGTALVPFVGLEGLARIYYERVGFLAAVTRILGSLMSAASVAVVWLVARALWGRLAAWFAAAAMSVGWLDVVCCHHPTADTPAGFLLIATCAWALHAYLRGLSTRGVVIGGVLAGAAAATKYPAGAGLIAVLLAVLMNERSCTERAAAGNGGSAGQQAARGNLSEEVSSNRPTSTGLSQKARMVGLATAAAAATFLLLVPWAILDWPNFFADLAYQAICNKTGPAPPWQMSWFWFYMKPAAGVGWPLNLFALLGIGALCFRRPRAAAIVLVPPLVVFVAFAAATVHVARWYAALAPFVALGTGVGLAAGIELIPHRLSRIAASAAVCGATLGPLAYQAIRYDAILLGPASRREAAKWVVQRVPPGSKVALFQWAWAGPDLTASRYKPTWYMPGSLEQFTAAEWLERRLRGSLGSTLRRFAPGAYAKLARRAEQFRQGAETADRLMPDLPGEPWAILNVTYWERMVRESGGRGPVREYHAAVGEYWRKLQTHLTTHYTERARFGQLRSQHRWDEWPYGDPLIVVYERLPDRRVHSRPAP